MLELPHITTFLAPDWWIGWAPVTGHHPTEFILVGIRYELGVTRKFSISKNWKNESPVQHYR